jgi:hypothetical protein
MSSQNTVEKKRTNLFDFAWGKIVSGVVLIGIIVYLNNLFTELETGARESVRINAVIAFLYNTLGHMPTIIILGIIALLLVGLGIRQLINERQS